MAYKRGRKKLKKWVKIVLSFSVWIFILGISLIIINNKKTTEINIINNYNIKSLRSIYKNDDIKAKLIVKGLDINTVITKGSNNVYYLNYDAYKKPNDAGNPFLDYRQNNDLINEKQINIYGHNLEGTKNLPFAKLTKYLDKEVFDNNKEILLYTEDSVLTYEVYALKVIKENEREHMLIKTDTETWQAHLDRLLINTKYCGDDCKLTEEDNILILQTCNFYPKDSYIIVIAKKRGDK